MNKFIWIRQEKNPVTGRFSGYFWHHRGKDAVIKKDASSLDLETCINKLLEIAEDPQCPIVTVAFSPASLHWKKLNSMNKYNRERNSDENEGEDDVGFLMFEQMIDDTMKEPFMGGWENDINEM